MIFITGDTHGQFDRIQKFCKQYKTSRDDVMVILGDVGFNYHLDERDEHRKRFVNALPITLFCIHGNHEERPELISSYEEIQWKSGKAYIESKYPNIIFAKDGETYDFNGKKVFVIGGAYSVDKPLRIARGWKWFESELPTEEDKGEIWNKLIEQSWEVDYVFTHTCPLKYEPIETFSPRVDQKVVDKTLETFLDKVEENLKYEKWLCGHFHTIKRSCNIFFMYENYIKL